MLGKCTHQESKRVAQQQTIDGFQEILKDGGDDSKRREQSESVEDKLVIKCVMSMKDLTVTIADLNLNWCK